MDPEPVFSFHHPVQPATPERKGTKGRGRQKGASVTAGKVKERQGEGGEGRKEREGGRRLGHEEGRLTDIAALAISSHTHTHRRRQTHILSQIVHCTVAALFFNPLRSFVFHPFFSSEQEDKRDTERGGRGGGERTRRRRRRRGGSNPLLSFTQTQQREIGREE